MVHVFINKWKLASLENYLEYTDVQYRKSFLLILDYCKEKSLHK